jgi:hypothetical protein
MKIYYCKKRKINYEIKIGLSSIRKIWFWIKVKIISIIKLNKKPKKWKKIVK